MKELRGKLKDHLGCTATYKGLTGIVCGYEDVTGNLILNIPDSEYGFTKRGFADVIRKPFPLGPRYVYITEAQCNDRTTTDL